jgi:ubiquinone biosynthesis protein COQ9
LHIFRTSLKFQNLQNGIEFQLEFSKQQNKKKKKESEKIGETAYLAAAQPAWPSNTWPNLPLSRRLPRAGKQLGGALENSRSAAVFPDGPDERRRP